MELVIFWAIINALVGAAIGQKKNAVGACIAVSILLGPIGWIIALVVEGNPAPIPSGTPAPRVCPFCAENIKPQAIVCPHCRRDLPSPPEPASTAPAVTQKARPPVSPDLPDPEDVRRVQELVQRYDQKRDEPYRL